MCVVCVLVGGEVYGVVVAVVRGVVLCGVVWCDVMWCCMVML